MGDRGFRRPYARPRRESDEGEEEGFLYCLMYYFGEYPPGAWTWGEEGKEEGGRAVLRLPVP